MATSTSIFNRLQSLLNRSPTKSAQESRGVAGFVETAVANRTRAEPEVQSHASQLPASPTSTPGASRKRKRSRGGVDVYEVEASPEPEVEISEHISKAAKRVRQEVKAKEPLVPPRRSKGQINTDSFQVQTRQASKASKNISKRSRVAPNPSTTKSPLPSEIAGPGPHQPAKAQRGVGRPPNLPKLDLSKSVAPKRGRGRPRKVLSPRDTPLSEDSPEPLPSQEQDNASRDEDSSEQPPSQEDHVGNLSGIDEILQSPSPIKSLVATKPSDSKAAKSKSSHRDREPAKEISELDEDEDEDDFFEHPDRPLIDLKHLKHMVAISKHVGCKHDKSSDTWSVIKHPDKPLTIPGKRLVRRLKQLKQGYQTRISGDAVPEEIPLNHSLVELIKSIEGEVLMVKNERFKVSKSSQNTENDTAALRRMLTDVYFIILPSFFDALYLCAKAHSIKEPVETISLEELVHLAELLQILVNVALKQHKDSQPRADRGLTYQVLKPIKVLKPQLGSFIKGLKGELGARRRANRALERETRRHEKDKADQKMMQLEEETSRKIQEIRRNQKRAMNKSLADPVIRKLVNAEIGKFGASQSRVTDNKGAQRGPPPSQLPQTFIDDGNGPFASDGEDAVERVKIIPKNNINGCGTAKPWTWDERSAFIAFMRTHGPRVKDRYQQLAGILNKTMDEVFSFAQDFQECMDIEHENLRLGEPCDEWTYDVWVENP